MATIKVCIEKDDAGKFFVSTETETGGDDDAAQSSGAPQSAIGGSPTTQPDPYAQPDDEASEQGNKVPAKSLDQALMLAAKLLSAPAQDGQSPFDQGMAKTMPQPMGM